MVRYLLLSALVSNAHQTSFGEKFPRNSASIKILLKHVCKSYRNFLALIASIRRFDSRTKGRTISHLILTAILIEVNNAPKRLSTFWWGPGLTWIHKISRLIS